MLQVSFEDVWDWAYCPLRVWWRRSALAPDVVGVEAKRTGEQLMRRSVRAALDAYYRLQRGGRGREVSVALALGHVWRQWLEGWGFGRDMSGALLEYHERRRALLGRFEKGGDIRRPDGSLYRRPTWTRWWRELAGSSGVRELRDWIDGQGEAAGLGRLELSEEATYQAPMGLADAFATAFDIVDRLKELPAPESVLGANVALAVDLLSVRLLCRADLLLDLGEVRRPGRPRKDGQGPKPRRKVAYELHLFEEDLPAPHSLARDLRVLALGQAYPEALGLEPGDIKLDRVLARHLLSGETQAFHPGLGDGAEILEALARGVVTGVRSGAYIPRMVCGWAACGDCEYRRLCFSDSGVMAAFNPPLMAQIRSSQKMVGRMRALVQAEGPPDGRAALLRSFAEWMARTPGLTPEGALWLLDAVEADSS